MTAQWEFAELRRPISSDAPCGESLEDSQLLASFDTFRLFGQLVPFNPVPDWREIETKARSALERSKDFRLLAYFSAATLRTKGLPAFLGTLGVAAQWLDEYWAQVYPLVDDDAILRKNALNSFADRMAIVDGIRRHPIVRHSQLGSFGLREIEIATGQTPVPEGEQAPDLAQLNAAFAANPVAEIRQLQVCVVDALDALKRVEARMRDEGGAQAVPTFDPLLSQLVQLQRVLNDQQTKHPEAGDTALEVSHNFAPESSAEAVRSRAPSAINSRQDAIRALDAVSAYFRMNEPSSPIPLFLHRAKRLVGKDFLEVLDDIAPEGLSQARNAGGLRDE